MNKKLLLIITLLFLIYSIILYEIVYYLGARDSFNIGYEEGYYDCFIHYDCCFSYMNTDNMVKCHEECKP